MFGRGKQGRCDNCDALAPDDEAFTFDSSQPPNSDDRPWIPFNSLDDPERTRLCKKCARKSVLEDEADVEA